MDQKTVEIFDHTLRKIDKNAPLLSHLRYLGDVIEVRFTRRPAGWPPTDVTALSPSSWSVPVREDQEQQSTNGSSPPVPALAVVGAGEAELLAVNLAQARPAVIHAQYTCPVSVLRALAIDLVRIPWSQTVTLHLVGFGEDLAQARPRQVASRTLDETLRTLADLQGEQPRSPHILMSGIPLESAVAQRRLQSLLAANPWFSALVVQPPGPPRLQAPWHIDVDHGTLTIDGQSWRGCLRTMTAAQAGHTVESLPALVGSTATLDAETTPPTPPPADHDRPVLRMLGTVSLDGVDTTRIEPGRQHAAAELAAYLILHPRATTTDLTTALWSEASNPTAARNRAISRLRKLLGRHEGWPNPNRSPDGAYRLTLQTDLEQFRTHVRLAETRQPLGAIRDLTTATNLVQGTPLHDPRNTRYHWADHDRDELTAEIIHAFHRLACLHIEAGNPRIAYSTARRGLDLHPTHSDLWRTAFHALHAFAPGQIDRALDRYTTTCTKHGLKADDATVELAHEIRQHQKRNRRPN